jgi:hypothetical protein
VIINNPAGTQVLELGDNGLVSGYVVSVYDEADRTWRRITTDSPFVHDVFPITETLDGRTLTLSVVVTGPDWATISTRVDALLDAVEVPGWQLEVGGVTWVCRPADSSAPMPARGTNADFRRVTLTFPVRQARGI